MELLDSQELLEGQIEPVQGSHRLAVASVAGHKVDHKIVHKAEHRAVHKLVEGFGGVFELGLYIRLSAAELLCLLGFGSYFFLGLC